MISFAMLSAFARAVFALWALLLLLINLGSAALATVKRRYAFTAFALVLFAPCYFLWQVIFDIYLSSQTGGISALSGSAGSLSRLSWLAAFAVLSLAAALLFGFNIRYDKSYITPGTIKLYLDKIPCGICCWRENGRVLFSNICMNELCKAVTGNSLLNGNQFCDAVAACILTIDGKVWRFARREITMDGERLWEMIASDITAEYAKTQALEKDKAELSCLNQELWDYYISIDESVQRQEILQAKMNIHDEMNRLMLSTVAADKDNTEALDKIFSLWEQNALLLCMEADEKAGGRDTGTLQALADALGISLILQGDLPPFSDKQSELFFFTAQEAIINAVKHSQAKEMKISFEKAGASLICRFENNGSLPAGEVRFEGGLANLARLAEKQGASISTEIGKSFALILKFN